MKKCLDQEYLNIHAHFKWYSTMNMCRKIVVELQILSLFKKSKLKIFIFFGKREF